MILLPDPVIEDYWVRWDPAIHEWEVSTDKGVTWRILAENPQAMCIIGLGGPLPKTPIAGKGILHFDGTAWQVYEGTTGPRRLLPVVTEAKGGILWNPNGHISPATIHAWRAPYACDVVEIWGIRRGGTGATINAMRNGSNHLAVDLSLTLANQWMIAPAVLSSHYEIGDRLELKMVSVTGSPTDVGVEVVIQRYM